MGIDNRTRGQKFCDTLTFHGTGEVPIWEGGLILRVDIYPDVPLENIEAILSAISEYQSYWVTK